jgi:hypothetical protein
MGKRLARHSREARAAQPARSSARQRFLGQRLARGDQALRDPKTSSTVNVTFAVLLAAPVTLAVI